MKPHIYKKLTYDQKLLYLQTTFAAARETHPVYAKMETLLHGRHIDEEYLDTLYEAVNQLVDHQDSLQEIKKLENLAEKLERIKILEAQSRDQEQIRIHELEEQILSL